MFDLIIVGGGTAGLTAAVYAARAGLDFIVLEQDGWGGGQITSAHFVENYPGVPNTSGADLGEILREQALSLGARIRLGIVEAVRDFGAYKELLLSGGEILQTKTLIAATGAVPKKLGLENEHRLSGRGISYCAVCDGAFFAGKDVFVVGGGDTAVEDAVYLASLCQSVTLIHRRSELRAAKKRTDYLKTLPNVQFLYQAAVTAVDGENRLETITVKIGDAFETLPAGGLFIAVGTLPVTDYLQNLPLSLADGYVIADETCRTSVQGIFAAGDIRRKQLRQAVTAAADGANAVYSAVEYLKTECR